MKLGQTSIKKDKRAARGGLQGRKETDRKLRDRWERDGKSWMIDATLVWEMRGKGGNQGQQG